MKPRRKADTRLKVVVANAYNGNRRRGQLRARLRMTRADVILACEGARLGPIRGYRRLAAKAGSHGRREVVVYVRRGLEVDDWSIERATDDTGKGVSHDRWMLWVRLTRGGEKVAAIATHYNAAIQRNGRIKASPGAREATKHGQALEGLIRREMLAGRSVFVGADFNFPITKRGWLSGPAELAYRLRMYVVGRGIDGLIYDRRWALVRSRIIRLPGSDHPGVVAVLRKRKG